MHTRRWRRFASPTSRDQVIVRFTPQSDPVGLYPAADLYPDPGEFPADDLFPAADFYPDGGLMPGQRGRIIVGHRIRLGGADQDTGALLDESVSASPAGLAREATLDYAELGGGADGTRDVNVYVNAEGLGWA
jgi:hypothetical protein